MAGAAQGQEALRGCAGRRLAGVEKKKGEMSAVERDYQAIILGGGQSGLATAYYLLRAGVQTVVLDDQEAPGGAWRHAWPSLRLFSPANASNLPGMMMPSYPGFPLASHVVDYFTKYEQRYSIPVERPVRIVTVTKESGRFVLSDAKDERWSADCLIVATGTWSAPFVPHYPGDFAGKQWHTANYPGAEPFKGQNVAVVGGGNSGAQIAAELTKVADVTWLTRRQPRFMPDDVDGRVLFRRNRERLNAMMKGEADPGPESQLGDIVAVEDVREARDAGELAAEEMVGSLDQIEADHLIWCTGFRPAVNPVRDLLDGMTPTVEGMFMVGYGESVGPGAATITGVSPFSKRAAQNAVSYLSKE